MAATPDPADVTALLQRCRGGESDAFERLVPLLYDELRALARRQLDDERRGHTLQATALVHEAFVKLVGQEKHDFNDRAHFLAIAAQAMRRVLLHHAEKRRAAKRGGAAGRVTLDEAVAALDARGDDVLAVDEALKRLAAEDGGKAQLVELRFFGGLTAEESAAVLGRSLRSVERDWRFARAWLRRALETGDAGAA